MVAVGRRPGVLLVALAIAAVVALAPAAARAGIAVLAPDLLGVLTPVATVVLLVALFPSLAGLYAPLAAPPDGPVSTVRRAGVAIGAHYRGLLVVGVLTSVAAIGAGLLAVLLWLPFDTLVRYARYAVADPGAPFAREQLLWLGAVLAIGASVGSVLVRLADTAVVHDGRGPRAALRTSLRFARHHTVSLAGFFFLIGALGTLEATLTTAVLEVVSGGGTDAAVAWLGTIPVFGLTIAVVAAVQSAYYRRTVAPAVASLGDPGGLAWRRIAVAGVVLLAAVGGAAVVRSHEIRHVGDEPEALPADPAGAYETALSNTAAGSHRSVTTSWNLTAGEERIARTVRAVDVPDRELTVFIHGRTHAIGGYYDPGVLGVYPGGRSSIASAREDRENWTALPAPGYGLGAQHDALRTQMPAADANWTVANRTPRTLRLRIESVEGVEHAIDGLTVRGADRTLEDGSYAEVVLDRRQRTVVRSELSIVTSEVGRLRHVTTIEAGETVEVTRPPGLGDRQPAEWLFATLYY
jgi:hypothetical protein